MKRTPKKYQSKILRNKEMNPEVYKLRRKVIDIIYEAKKVWPAMPRVEVRITENDDHVLAQGTMNHTHVIWISTDAILKKQYDLRTVVYHELGHAVLKLPHIDTCPLMKSTVLSPLSKEQCEKIFNQYVAKRGQWVLSWSAPRASMAA